MQWNQGIGTLDTDSTPEPNGKPSSFSPKVRLTKRFCLGVFALFCTGFSLFLRLLARWGLALLAEPQTVSEKTLLRVLTGLSIGLVVLSLTTAVIVSLGFFGRNGSDAERFPGDGFGVLAGLLAIPFDLYLLVVNLILLV